MNPHCRIGKVTPKSNIRLLPKIRAQRDVADIMRSHVEVILSRDADRFAGFAIVAWTLDGRFTRGVHIDNASFVGQTLLPSFVADVLRRDTAADVTREVLRGEA